MEKFGVKVRVSSHDFDHFPQFIGFWRLFHRKRVHPSSIKFAYLFFVFSNFRVFVIGLPPKSAESKITKRITKTRNNESTKKHSLLRGCLSTPHGLDRTHSEQNRDWLRTRSEAVFRRSGKLLKHGVTLAIEKEEVGNNPKRHSSLLRVVGFSILNPIQIDISSTYVLPCFKLFAERPNGNKLSDCQLAH